jgi:hypothetical protein
VDARSVRVCNCVQGIIIIIFIIINIPLLLGASFLLIFCTWFW